MKGERNKKERTKALVIATPPTVEGNKKITEKKREKEREETKLHEPLQMGVTIAHLAN